MFQNAIPHSPLTTDNTHNKEYNKDSEDNVVQRNVK